MAEGRGVERPEQSCEVPDHLDRLLATIVETAVRDGSPWRIPQDAADRTYDRLVDRVIEGSPPTSPIAWTQRVLQNHLKKGPDRVGLTGARFTDIRIESLVASDGEDEMEDLRRELVGLKREAERVLTAAEHRAFECMLVCESMCEAAVAAGMSMRDIRTRRRRIVKKLRAILGPD